MGRGSGGAADAERTFKIEHVRSLEILNLELCKQFLQTHSYIHL